ncbi:MAG TPA: response regulator [Chthoniobacterales bacterium]|jgi:CheY-like chemotaxis protein
MKPKRILIVDDESGFTHLLRLTLEGSGKFLVEEVNDGRKALETARYFKPDIVFLDVVMPEIDGGDVAKLLRADPEFATVPIVFLTAIVSPKEAQHQTDIGGFPFLAKPVSVDSIVKAVDAHCP